MKAIKVENLSKAYQLGEIGTGTISRDLERWIARVRGKEDPFLTIGEVNDRTSKGTGDVVWSLKDINFEIEQGDAVGIIGRNGAGKSTLLKLLSRVTSPTTGNIKVKGRIASLLEVGTGFHPELTGRENIYLNGAILGMRKKEISKKFDEILDFAGVERYVDTPVKRYSSGMYVRLAFAVAAHLESEILIVDEVLAVGDAEFQKKCLGKMSEVSKGEGRTVLFVSHQLSSVKQLCNTGILMSKGNSTYFNNIEKALEKYQYDNTTIDLKRAIHNDENKTSYIGGWYLLDKQKKQTFTCYTREFVDIKIEIIVKRALQKAEFGFIIRNNTGDIIFSCNSRDFNGTFINLSSGNYIIGLKMRLPLKSDSYVMDFAIAEEGRIIDNWVSPNPLKILSDYEGVLDEKWLGILNEEFQFGYEKTN